MITEDEDYMFWVMNNVEEFWLDPYNISVWEKHHKGYALHFLDFKHAGGSPLAAKLTEDSNLPELESSVPTKFTKNRETLEDWVAKKEDEKIQKEEEEWTDSYGGSLQEAQDMAREDNKTMGDLGMWSDSGD